MLDAFATVRVEASTCLDELDLPRRDHAAHGAVRGGVCSVGHTGRMFNAMKNRIRTAMEVPFVRYTVLALEMRRFLAEARAKNESFSLTYTHLEAWRRALAPHRVRSNGHPRRRQGSRKCSIAGVHRRGLRCECGADENGAAAAPRVARDHLVQQPYPVLDEEKEDRSKPAQHVRRSGHFAAFRQG